MQSNCHVLEVWGPFACFTRPELKVERFSYPCITPSAARAIYEAIYWKPKFRWQVTAIEVLSPPCYIALCRNEVKNRVPSPETVEKWITGALEPEPIWADGAESQEKGRTQRQTMALKGVHYRLSAEIRPWPDYTGELPAMESQFRRRATAGQCIYQPYLGCREFPAFFRLAESGAQQNRLALDLEVGWMLYDVFDLSRPGTPTDPPAISWFQASIRDGLLEVPDYGSPAVRRPGDA